jgi:O-methyltransferase domain/Dimerisation domain
MRHAASNHDGHRSQSPPAQAARPYRSATGSLASKRLLELMTGAWTTQAIAVAAELGIADHLASEGTATGTRLATLTGTDEESLSRLLRFLASLGIVRRKHDEFRLAELGQLLRTDMEYSLRPLALIYGGPFYQTFAHLMHSVRTGHDAFEHFFGKNHFDYFAEHPELGNLFNRAMASSASMFDPITELVDFSDARVVVDVAGGNGELLRRILHAAPHLHGVLLERPNAIESARSVLARAGCAERAELVSGDFTRDIPHGGDVYILSRVLHDWDDRKCRALLKRCADAMPEWAQLLIVERLLPEDETPSLAVAWDLQMMCSVGGRERSVSQYSELLAESGFELIGQHPLPLDAALLRARLSGSRAIL